MLDFVDQSGGDINAIVNGIEVISQSGTMPSGTFRPWATKYYHGQVYVGGVCDAQISQNRDHLSATVYRFDPATTTFSVPTGSPATRAPSSSSATATSAR